MRIKNPFTVPTNENVTEKHLYRVLLCSVCSILLCMGCLAGTTWAWFTVSIENTGNVIHIGEPSVTVLVDGTDFTSGTELSGDEHTVSVIHANDGDVFQKKSMLYVTLSVDEVVQGYVLLEQNNGYSADIRLTTGRECVLSWTVSWFEPNNAEPVADGFIGLQTDETEMSGETTEVVDTGTEPTGETAEVVDTGTEPSGETAPPAETGLVEEAT